MKSAVYFPPEYFLKYKEKPVKLKPYTKTQGEIGEQYLEKVSKILKNFEVDVMIRGSTAYKIVGKGDVEIGIYPKVGDWEKIVSTLIMCFGEPENIENNYVRFNILHNDTEVELILLKGREAIVDRKLQEYLLSHDDLLKEYENIKIKYAYSKREYNFRKNEFLRKVEEMIPE